MRKSKRAKNLQWLEDFLACKFGRVDTLAWRHVAVAFGQVARTTIGGGRGHPKILAQMFLRQGADEADPSLADAVKKALARYHEAFAAFEGHVDSLGSVLASGTEEATRAVLDGAVRTKGVLDDLGQAVDALARWKSDRRAGTSVAKKKLAAKIGQALKPLEKGGTPPFLARHMAMAGMIPKPEGFKAENWPELLPSSIAVLDAASPAGAPEGEFAWNTPHVFNLAGDLPVGSVREMFVREEALMGVETAPPLDYLSRMPPTLMKAGGRFEFLRSL